MMLNIKFSLGKKEHVHTTEDDSHVHLCVSQQGRWGDLVTSFAHQPEDPDLIQHGYNMCSPLWCHFL